MKKNKQSIVQTTGKMNYKFERKRFKCFPMEFALEVVTMRSVLGACFDREYALPAIKVSV